MGKEIANQQQRETGPPEPPSQHSERIDYLGPEISADREMYYIRGSQTFLNVNPNSHKFFSHLQKKLLFIWMQGRPLKCILCGYAHFN